MEHRRRGLQGGACGRSSTGGEGGERVVVLIRERDDATLRPVLGRAQQHHVPDGAGRRDDGQNGVGSALGARGRRGATEERSIDMGAAAANRESEREVVVLDLDPITAHVGSKIGSQRVVPRVDARSGLVLVRLGGGLLDVLDHRVGVVEVGALGERDVAVAAVLGVVHADRLDLVRDADAVRVGELEEGHEQRDVGAGPADVGEDEADGGAERAAVAAVEDAGAVILAVRVIGLGIVELGREEGGRDDAPEAARAVDGEGVDDVVDLELDERLGGAEVDGRGDHAGEEGAPRVGGRAARGDGDEAGEDAVVRRGGVDDVRQAVRDGDVEDARRRGRDGRRHEDVRRDAAVALDGERRGAVEAVPADPEDEHAERLEDDRLLLEVARRGAEAALARADEGTADDRRDATRHVDDARPGEVDHAAAAEEPVRPPRRELAVARPAQVNDGGVDVRHEQARVRDVRAERRALGDGARHDRRRRPGERPLEHPRRLAVRLGLGRVGQRRRVVARADALVEEARAAVEPVDARRRERVRPERQRVARRPPEQRRDHGVEQILDEDVLRVLDLHRPDLEHREARLHEEHQARAEQEPKRITVGSVRLAFLDRGHALFEVRNARQEVVLGRGRRDHRRDNKEGAEEPHRLRVHHDAGW
mmetsp:Transcript_15810/g.63655  ORF Transcript_15810/g.63655 Transcript_15810/m.63655 type:complete len:651 (+) Transcript_15810:246-2198(+)